MLSVKNNMKARNANRQLGIITNQNTKRAEKLSSGYRINRAADDAAGLSISEKMRRQMRGLTKAAENAQDGISMVQIGEGALNEVHDMLQRANELSIKAATGTLQDSDRMMIDAELQQLKAEIDSTARNTTFNEIQLFPENGISPNSVGYVNTKKYNLVFDLEDGSVTVSDADAGAAASGSKAGAVSTGSILADTIANELVPNAVKQILDGFPAFKTAMAGKEMSMGLEIAFEDGPGNKLAYASAQFYMTPGTPPISMMIKVDSADFSDADVGGAKMEELESTLAHELMHSVMQFTLLDGMAGRGGVTQYPTWFKEGTAQLTGGGFPTNWNYELQVYAGALSGEDDHTYDTRIGDYLAKYTMDGRPYGHGYLGCAYLGYLANGKGAVTGAGIAAGMNKIFADLLAGKSLDNAIKDQTGITVSQLNNMFASKNTDLRDFIRRLAYNSKGGAGSVTAPTLASGGDKIIGTGASKQPLWIDPNRVSMDYTPSGGGLGGTKGVKMVALQVGAEAGIHIDVDLFCMNTKGLDLENLNVKTTDDADQAIDRIKRAIGYVSNVRSHYGAIQNRLEHTIRNLNNITENTTAAESQIRDTDIATEMVGYSNNQILMQAGTSMLTQANQSSQLILNLLG